eukprot:scpid104153/ scgid3650/ 
MTVNKKFTFFSHENVSKANFQTRNIRNIGSRKQATRRGENGKQWHIPPTSCGKEGIGGSRFVSRNSNRTLSMLRLRSSAVAGGSRWGSIHNFLTVLENVGGSNFYSVVI